MQQPPTSDDTEPLAPAAQITQREEHTTERLSDGTVKETIKREVTVTRPLTPSDYQTPASGWLLGDTTGARPNTPTGWIVDGKVQAALGAPQPLPPGGTPALPLPDVVANLSAPYVTSSTPLPSPAKWWQWRNRHKRLPAKWRAQHTASGTPIMPEEVAAFMASLNLPEARARVDTDGEGVQDTADLGRPGIRASRDLTPSGHIDWPEMVRRNARIAQREVAQRIPGPTTRRRIVREGWADFKARPLLWQFFISLGVVLLLVALLFFPLLIILQHAGVTTALMANTSSTSTATCCATNASSSGATSPATAGAPTATVACAERGCGNTGGVGTPPPVGSNPTPPTGGGGGGGGGSNSHASSATVSFTPATQTETGNGSMTACGSGCTISSHSTSGSTSASHTQAATGYQARATGNVSIYCTGRGSQCIPPDSLDISGSAGNCGNYSGFGVPTTVGCTVYGTSNVWAGGISGCYYSICWNNGSAFANTSYHYVLYGDCHGAMNAAYSSAASAASGKISGALSGDTIVSSNIQANGNDWACPPGIGAVANTVTGQATAEYNAWGFTTSDAQHVAAQRVDALLTAGWYWSAGPNACNPTYSVSGSTANITCADSGTATADWRASSSNGQQAQSMLQHALAGMSLEAALAYCNSTTGIVAGSCHISLSPDTAQALPTDPSAITISA
jgi:hypothetical protein